MGRHKSEDLARWTIGGHSLGTAAAHDAMLAGVSVTLLGTLIAAGEALGVARPVRCWPGHTAAHRASRSPARLTRSPADPLTR